MKFLKKTISLFLAFLPHLNIALGLTLLVLLVTDRFNRALAFINNDITKGMLLVWCFLVILQSIVAIRRQRKG